jgi:hypothetical protein
VTTTIPSDPIPGNSPIACCLRMARERYHATHPWERPSLANGSSCCGLFEPAAMVALARAGCWPLPPRARRYIAEAPHERARRRRRRARQIACVVRDILAEDLPEALDVLTAPRTTG